jgi:hypothetical protein
MMAPRGVLIKFLRFMVSRLVHRLVTATFNHTHAQLENFLRKQKILKNYSLIR